MTSQDPVRLRGAQLNFYITASEIEHCGQCDVLCVFRFSRQQRNLAGSPAVNPPTCIELRFYMLIEYIIINI
jgi:hypothetical protein